MLNLLLVGGAVVLLACITVLVRIALLERKLHRMFGGNRDKTVEGLVYEHSTALDEAKKEISKLSESHGVLKSNLQDTVQKVAMVRYNPFSDSGGDQSFAVAMLDGNDTGVIFSSLYARSGPMIYAKPIEKGASQYALTDEERKVLDRAMQQ
jgi:predicted phosphohydrolase